MFVRQPQFRNASADVQIFYGDATSSTVSRFKKTWNKPPGVSHVYMLLIGGGGVANGTNGGGSGAVTVWYGAAQNVPDCLEILVSAPGSFTNTTVSYRGTSATPVDLLTALTSGNTSGAASTTAGVFAASGFYQSTTGTNGGSGTISPSSTTFLSGGADQSGIVQANYGYGGTVSNGYFQLQPIIVGVGGTNQQPPYSGGIGCGGGTTGGKGGAGLVLIASW